MNVTRRNLLSAIPLLPAIRLLRGQEQRPNFSADVKVVNLFATVRDKKDQIIKNLTRDDFLLDEDGRPQTIKFFSQESDLPLTVGLLVDTSGSVRRVLPDERDASDRFLHQVLRPEKDLAFIIHFDFEVELLQDLTGSRELLEKALAQLDSPQLQRGGNGGGGYPRGGGGYPGGGGGGYPGGQGGRRGGGTLLYDAVFLGSDEIMHKQSGRKALILLSDGEDNGSRKSLFGAVESAQRSDTLVYTILFTDPNAGYGYPGGFGGPRMGRRGGMGYPRGPQMNRPDGKKVMQQIASQTGGRFFEVSHRMPIEKIFAAIEEDLRNQYNIGYTPDANASAGYRRIHLTTRDKNFIVQTREGYYGS
ncbi:MAG TPA: VWA domain-containing protein [Thermoanaerobaculia bacterium]|nr:VWA domain-containing protein [Thermoanaerobaculia bacterium]